MSNLNENNDELPLSDDPEENLRMENELLKLKMQAELGSRSYTAPDIDPEIENEFLKNVLAFEQNYAKSKQVKVYDLLGRPDYKKAEDLPDLLLEEALDDLIDLLSEKNIAVDFDEEIAPRTRYIFITEELFEEEMDDFTMPGMICHFDYEEFHPNHKKDIERRALDFITGWFNKSLDEKSPELGDGFIQPDGKLLSKEAVVARIKRIFERCTAFTDEKYEFFDIGFQLDGPTGMGHAEGGVKYLALLDTGETIPIGGAFKLYMSLDYGWWNIVHIVFPGFQYPQS